MRGEEIKDVALIGNDFVCCRKGTQDSQNMRVKFYGLYSLMVDFVFGSYVV